jgi:hypothetical protein
MLFPARKRYFFQALGLVLFAISKTIKKTAQGGFGGDSVLYQITK